MAAPQPIPAVPGQGHQKPPLETMRGGVPLTDGSGTNAGHALVPAPRLAEEEDEPAFSPRVMRLPVELDITVPISDFRVRNLLSLAPDQLIETQWASGNDLPLAAGDVRVAWTEFEVVETRLAVRVTRVE